MYACTCYNVFVEVKRQPQLLILFLHLVGEQNLTFVCPTYVRIPNPQASRNSPMPTSLLSVGALTSLCILGIQTQGLMLASQTCYHLSYFLHLKTIINVLYVIPLLSAKQYLNSSRTKSILQRNNLSDKL